ncbi:hypothetical protein [Streptomyces olivochromogenes]|uniref:hypothetical protein n=1 Tax=Streptomyces olivochromogenes TaxID=1963 RepID=UPI0007483BD8|nr:hypothetical protein [Streptomyces olivochromogenes]KUN45506.1 hypothetical protein AQJ27_21475 [Streptomyces olivochromogenes]
MRGVGDEPLLRLERVLQTGEYVVEGVGHGLELVVGAPHRQSPVEVVGGDAAGPDDDLRRRLAVRSTNGPGRRPGRPGRACRPGPTPGRLDVKVTGNAFDPTSDAYEEALDTCAPILKKAGSTFPDPSGLPPLPEPGEGAGTGTGPGKSLYIEPGTPGDPGLPSLTTSGSRHD